MQVNRTEHKYLITRQQCTAVQAQLRTVLAPDANCKSLGGYEIRSLYFDTVADRCCVEKEDGLQVHEKIRARIYGLDDRIIKLESKRKVGEQQVKRTMLITREELDRLCRGEYEFLLTHENPMALYFYRKLSQGMRPKTIVQYWRMSYCTPVNNTRITFDMDIRATESSFDLFQEPLHAHPILPMNMVIMEVKYNHFLLQYIRDALRGLNEPRISYSKYLNGRTFYRHIL